MAVGWPCWLALAPAACRRPPAPWRKDVLDEDLAKGSTRWFGKLLPKLVQMLGLGKSRWLAHGWQLTDVGTLTGLAHDWRQQVVWRWAVWPQVGKELAKSWQRVGKELAQSWQRVGRELAKSWQHSWHNSWQIDCVYVGKCWRGESGKRLRAKIGSSSGKHWHMGAKTCTLTEICIGVSPRARPASSEQRGCRPNAFRHARNCQRCPTTRCPARSNRCDAARSLGAGRNRFAM